MGKRDKARPMRAGKLGSARRSLSLLRPFDKLRVSGPRLAALSPPLR